MLIVIVIKLRNLLRLSFGGGQFILAFGVVQAFKERLFAGISIVFDR